MSQELKRLTRGNFFGEQVRIKVVYGCSPLASKVWLAYAHVLGLRSPAVEETLVRARWLARRPLDNLHGEIARRRVFSFGQRLVRESVAREARGEPSMLLSRQALS